jgi:hypothetical protein
VLEGIGVLMGGLGGLEFLQEGVRWPGGISGDCGLVLHKWSKSFGWWGVVRGGLWWFHVLICRFKVLPNIFLSMTDDTDFQYSMLCAKFKIKLQEFDRDICSEILYEATQWLQKQIPYDGNANDAFLWFQHAHSIRQHNTTDSFLKHHFWDTFKNNYKCHSFRIIIESIINNTPPSSNLT